MSLRMRHILSYILVIALCLGIAALALLLPLRDYSNKLAIARLGDMAIPIYVQARSLAKGDASLDEVWTKLKEQAQETGVGILVIDSQGNVIRKVLPPGISKNHLDKLPAGKLTTDISEHHHGTFVTPGGQVLVFAAYPLAGLFRTQRPSAPDALILAVPRAELITLWTDFASPLLWAGLIAFVVSVGIAIVLARSVYLPVQRVTEGAQEIAQGHYDHQIPIAGPPETKRLALSFNQMAKQVEHSQKMLRDFLANVSHELRSPLTSIRGFAQAMLDGTAKGSEAQSKAARVIESESKRMIRLVDELLELSRIESGQIKMSWESIDTIELLQHCQDIFRMRAEEKGIELRNEVEPIPSLVGDIDRLEQVFSNLLDNALKHTPPGGEVTITAQKVSPDFIEIAVTDTGPGIPAEELAHVFERFYQSQGSAREESTGLGLTIARGIVRAHGGDVEAKNAPGGGAEFVVRLPTSKS